MIWLHLKIILVVLSQAALVTSIGDPFVELGGSHCAMCHQIPLVMPLWYLHVFVNDIEQLW